MLCYLALFSLTGLTLETIFLGGWKLRPHRCVEIDFHLANLRQATSTWPVLLFGCSLHLLYLDESGSLADPNQNFFVLAGVSVFERRTHWVEQELNKVVERFDSAEPHQLELHGSPMRSGRENWKRFGKTERWTAIKEALDVGVRKQKNGVRLFGAVVKKRALSGVDAHSVAFEELCSRFDLYLKRLFQQTGEAQRGLMLFDKSNMEGWVQSKARQFKYEGHSWGRIKNFAEVPVFLDSKASRLVQLADLVAFSIFRKYEYSDSEFFDVIKDCFFCDGSVQHGFVEVGMECSP